VSRIFDATYKDKVCQEYLMVLIRIRIRCANKMNCELMLTYDTPAYMFNVYTSSLHFWPSFTTEDYWLSAVLNLVNT
jgi:hypothetical protein